MRSDIELLRIVSAFGIVWFHSGYPIGREFAYSGLIVFLVLSAYFSMKSERQYSVGDRVMRLIVPCMLWSIVYAVLDIVRGKNIYPGDYSLFSEVLSTPSIHLWYLPFVFFWLILIDRIKAYNATALAVGSALLMSVCLVSAPVWRQWNYISPLEQYAHATPAILFGMFLALSNQLSSIVRWGLLGLIISSTTIVMLLEIPGMSITYSVGICAALLLLREKSLLEKNSVIFNISKLTFGIYLLHPLMLSILRFVGVGSPLLPILAFLIAAVSIYLLYHLIPKSIVRYIA